MKASLVLLCLGVLFAVVFAVNADNRRGTNFGYKNSYGYGDPETRLYNAKRQLYVNSVARHVGSGLGTAPYFGVPGSYFSIDAGYGYGGNRYNNNAGYYAGRNDGYGRGH